MANNDRDRRLLDASSLHDAIDSLSKVKEEQRIEFIHDRMMSAIDDICKTHQKTGKEKFTGPQIAILKDVVFHVIYILDTKNRPPKGFLKRLFAEFRSQGPIKQIGIGFTVLGVLFAAGTSVVSNFDTWGLPALQYLHVVSKPAPLPPLPAAKPTASPSSSSIPTLADPLGLRAPTPPAAPSGLLVPSK